MKRFQFAILAAVLLFAAVPCTWAQQPQEPDMDQIINSQLENLTRSFKLDEVQVFFVDSVLQHNFPAMTQEFEDTRRTGASNQETYQIISDKWMAATDEAFQRIFTEEQWAKYLKSSYGKEKKRRDKRIQERGL
ncbi:MAG: hypothetical protein IJ636_01215 [Bacteroidales bacterium]|nr:hypothetical protein [Bacteroidales bacterium]